MSGAWSVASAVRKADGFGIAADAQLYGGRCPIPIDIGFDVARSAARRVADLASRPDEVARLVLGVETAAKLVEAGLPVDFSGGLLHVARMHGDELLQRRVHINKLRKGLRSEVRARAMAWQRVRPPGRPATPPAHRPTRPDPQNGPPAPCFPPATAARCPLPIRVPSAGARRPSS